MILGRTFKHEYVFHEYPKWVKCPNGNDVLVKNEHEEAAILGVIAKSEEEPSERERLMGEAKALGLSPHHRTGEDKLKEMIEKAR